MNIDLKELLSPVKWFFSLPIEHQIGYVIILFILMIHTVNCVNLKYPLKFIIKDANSNQIIQEEITVNLRHNGVLNNFTTSNGKYPNRKDSLRLKPGEYKISIKPERFKIVEPETITVSKDSENHGETIYVTIKFTNKEDQETKDIKPPAPRLVTPSKQDEPVILYTLIEKIDNLGKNSPLQNLNIANFSIIERYQNKNHNAKITSLTTLESSSLNIVLVLDISGSMKNYLEQVKTASIAFIQRLKQIPQSGKSSGKVNILLVNGESISDNNFLISYRDQKTIGVDFNDDELEGLINKISDASVTGNTPLYDGIELAIDRLSALDENAYNVIVCLTDGKNNKGKINKNPKLFPKFLSKLVEKQTPVFIIGYDSGTKNSLHIERLIEISKESGAGAENLGSFINPNFDQLENLFTEIANSISNAYKLEWKSTGAAIGEKVEVSIEVEYEAAQKTFETVINKSYTLPNSTKQKVTSQ